MTSSKLVRASVRLAAPRSCRVQGPQRKANVQCRAADAAAAEAPAVEAIPITVSDGALKHLKRMKEEKGDDALLLRVGVRSGGCSGMSYAMDFESSEKVAEDDAVMEFDGFQLVCDPQSLLYLFGMRLDFSDALVGGGFQFQNPNAEDTCGCGKSFGV